MDKDCQLETDERTIHDEEQALSILLSKKLPTCLEMERLVSEILSLKYIAQSTGIGDPNSSPNNLDLREEIEKYIELTRKCSKTTVMLTNFINASGSSFLFGANFNDYLESEGVKKDQIEGFLRAMAKASIVDLECHEKFLKSIKKQGREKDTKHYFTERVSDLLGDVFGGSDHAMSTLISEIFSIFGVKVSVGAITQRLRDRKL